MPPINQDQIESSKQQGAASIAQELLQDANKVKEESNTQLINLYSTVSPAVLSGLFGVAVANIYQWRQNGKLPPNSDANYVDSIKHFVTYLRGKAGGKVANLQEAATLQKIQLDRARTEKGWLEILAERGELVDRAILADVFEPLFIQVKSQLSSMARKHPEMSEDVDNVMKTWQKIGEKMSEVATADKNSFVELQMEYEPELDTEDGEDGEEDTGPQNGFGEKELL